MAFTVYPAKVPQPKAKTTTRPALTISDLQAVERDFAFVVDKGVEALTALNAAQGADKALITEVRLFDQLFLDKNPENVDEGQDFISNINPHSLDILPVCYVEPALKDAAPLSRYQFERIGYFCVDPDSASEKLVFNRTATLRDTWAKIQKQQKK